MSAKVDIRDIYAGADADPALYGKKGMRLSKLAAIGAPVKTGVIISTDAVSRFATEGMATVLGDRFERAFGNRAVDALLAMRASAGEREWGGPAAVVNIGVCDAAIPILTERVGARAAWDLYRRLIQTYAPVAMGADADIFEMALHDQIRFAGVHSETDLPETALIDLVARYKELVEEETDDTFPQDPRAQLHGAIAAMARNWSAVTARILRTSRGGPEDGGLAIIVQEMALGLGEEPCGAGFATFRSERDGAPLLTGRYLPSAQGEDAIMGLRTPRMITAAERVEMGLHDPSFEELANGALTRLTGIGQNIELSFADAFEISFTLERGALFIQDAKPMRRSPQAAIRIAVDLAEGGAITRRDAVARIDPGLLNEILHPTIDPNAHRDVIATGLPASPGAASGRIFFSAEAAQIAANRGDSVILVRVETSPEDISGLHVASGILTARGGMTSHAAVVARGLGLPGVVGASGLMLDMDARRMTTDQGRVFQEGDVISLDGGAGQALAGAAPTLEPQTSDQFARLMDWADDIRRLKVRANADTPHDADIALSFGAEGIGLCRTEHMFFERGRINAMRQVILAEDEATRTAALDRLAPMQRGDFADLFRKMSGRPVTIRLLDPPLHEFLPQDTEDLRALAADMGLPVESVMRRAEDLHEFNPMLGMRGCRLGIVAPEIYAMQARAIFEALDLTRADGAQIVRPELMIPLVSAQREVAMIRSGIERVAAALTQETGFAPDYSVGVMVETPRAALKAGEIAPDVAFLSFGTNDLTQMTYGLSRDDAGRFMRDYLATGVYSRDPFHSLDPDGVGELLLIATERARAVAPGMALGLCGEHGGDPASILFCEQAGFDYVSCSPFRVPIARLAAAQATIKTADRG